MVDLNPPGSDSETAGPIGRYYMNRWKLPGGATANGASAAVNPATIPLAPLPVNTAVGTYSRQNAKQVRDWLLTTPIAYGNDVGQVDAPLKHLMNDARTEA